MAIPNSLPPVPAGALQAFKASSDDIIRAVVARAMEHTDQVAVHGDKAERVLAAGMRYTTLGLQTAIFLHNTTLLDLQLTWAADRLRHDGVTPELVLTNFEIYAEVVESMLLPEDAQAINQYVRWMIARQREFVSPTP